MVSSKVSNKLINFILFQLVWVGYVIGAAKDFIWLGMVFLAALLLWQLWPSRRAENDVKLMIASAIVGFIISSVWAFSGLISFKYHWPVEFLSPWWIIALWISFGATLNHSLEWLHQNKIIGACCGAIGGPMSYAAAARIGAVEIQSPWLTYGLMSVVWFLAVLLLVNTERLLPRHNKGWFVDVGH